MPPRPRTWLVESILVTLLCCVPFGIVGIIHAAKVNELWDRGDLEAAEAASRDAKRWTTIGFWCGLIPVALLLLFYGSVFAMFIAAAVGAAAMN
ncbi:MAG: CD225/dispanin family protein [Flavobacteriales bacterium]|nr:CD225/dispanin family protein [Flavobacteriales bacterium]